MESNHEELKKLVEDGTHTMAAQVKKFEERYDWNEEIKESDAKKIVENAVVKIERKLVRHKLEIEEMVERRISQGNSQLEHVIRDELMAIERRLSARSRRYSSSNSSYFTKEVQQSVREANRRRWRASSSSSPKKRSVARPLFSTGRRLSSVFYSSTSSSMGTSPLTPPKQNFKFQDL